MPVGARPPATARRRGISNSLLFAWRKGYRAGGASVDPLPELGLCRIGELELQELLVGADAQRLLQLGLGRSPGRPQTPQWAEPQQGILGEEAVRIGQKLERRPEQSPPGPRWLGWSLNLEHERLSYAWPIRIVSWHWSPSSIEPAIEVAPEREDRGRVGPGSEE